MFKFVPRQLGWIPDLPDTRDLTIAQSTVSALLNRLPRKHTGPSDEIDLRFGDEGEAFLSGKQCCCGANFSSAQAVMRLAEYFERRSRGLSPNGSVSYLYKTARNLARMSGDGGVGLRTTLRAVKKFGIVDESYWRDNIAQDDREPPAFVYGVASFLPEFDYVRVVPDVQRPPSLDRWEILCDFLAAGFPVIFGFSIPDSITEFPDILLRPQFDGFMGGVSAIAVGYNSHRYGRNQAGLLIGTPWGNQWGDDGFGWLPKAFVDEGLARDFWTIVYRDELDKTEFFCPAAVT
ncbi:hypothetical protein FF011L_35250 [Roseimaritima multifibrata]|uniref:Papain family cysteine protease n=1 Tax=Roseimaritima multifibrata TaxID=1930274 RepID=A0A517MIR5_9BACT|nr:C1 family peptidase [Roseimaritima multifibrata]QDS94744.1 hypothetical protein FF011L_35250 [Roseimaritima multifibrata]